MLKRFSYKQRLKMLPVGMTLSFLLIYGIAVRDTLRIKDECHNLAEQCKIIEDAPKQVAIIRDKLTEINLVAGRSLQALENDLLLEFLSKSKANMAISLVDYQPSHIFRNNNYQIETRVAVFEGSYINLLKFLYNLEKDFKAGKIVSTKFQTESNFKANKKRLLMILYIQSIESGENNPDNISSPLSNLYLSNEY